MVEGRLSLEKTVYGKNTIWFDKFQGISCSARRTSPPSYGPPGHPLRPWRRIRTAPAPEGRAHDHRSGSADPTQHRRLTLDEENIRALLESVKASIPALIKHMKDTWSETEINANILSELNILPADGKEDLVRLYTLTDSQWTQIRPFFPLESAGRCRAFKKKPEEHRKTRDIL